MARLSSSPLDDPGSPTCVRPHPDRLLREGDLDPLLVERLLEPLAQGAHDPPLLGRLCLDDEADRDPARPECLHAPHRGLVEDVLLLARNLVGDPLDHPSRLLQVGGVGDLDVEQGACPVLRHVPHPHDLAVRHVPDRALDRAQPGSAQAEVLHRARPALAEIDDVADRELVLEQDEDPGDEILDERLGSEPDRQSGDAGAGDQGGEVDPELGEDQEAGHEPDPEARGASEDRRERLHSLARARLELLLGSERRLGSRFRPSGQPLGEAGLDDLAQRAMDRSPGDPDDDERPDQDQRDRGAGGKDPLGDVTEQLAAG
jgi:hypothetical protein